MPGLMQNVIVSAAPDPATRTVRLSWQDGSVTRADFTSLLDRGVFARLADPAFFGLAEVTDDGHVLAWPGDLQFDADALWFQAHPEDSPSETALLQQ